MPHSVIVEEHHEAFFAWQYARANGWIPRAAATLLHVDEYADMGLPVLRRPLREIQGLRDAAVFTYDELAINNYIWPAVYQGLFDSIYWLRIRHAARIGGRRQLRVAVDSATETVFTATSETSHGAATEYCPVSLDHPPARIGPCVLNIDLNYFCTDTPPSGPLREIEVTEEAYRHFTTSRYHFLRLVLHCKVSPVERDRRFFLVFNEGLRVTESLTAADVVERRVEEFAHFLEEAGATPMFTVISRSCRSGYVDPRNARLATEMLAAKLPLGETHDLQSLMAPHWQPEMEYAHA